MNIEKVIRAHDLYQIQKTKEAEEIRFINKAEDARQRMLRTPQGRLMAEASKQVREEMRK